MSDTTQESMLVALLDRNGRLLWTSSRNPRRPWGETMEKYVRADERANAQHAVHKVIVERESHKFQIANDIGEDYRVWIWPLESHDVAACALCIRIPDELAQLTMREQDCSELLAQGVAAGELAQELDVSVSTVHTLLRRARGKLRLDSTDELVSFAARYCFPRFDPPHSRTGRHRAVGRRRVRTGGGK